MNKKCLLIDMSLIPGWNIKQLHYCWQLGLLKPGMFGCKEIVIPIKNNEIIKYIIVLIKNFFFRIF